MQHSSKTVIRAQARKYRACKPTLDHNEVQALAFVKGHRKLNIKCPKSEVHDYKRIVSKAVVCQWELVGKGRQNIRCPAQNIQWCILCIIVFEKAVEKLILGAELNQRVCALLVKIPGRLKYQTF